MPLLSQATFRKLSVVTARYTEQPLPHSELTNDNPKPLLSEARFWSMPHAILYSVFMPFWDCGCCWLVMPYSIRFDFAVRSELCRRKKCGRYDFSSLLSLIETDTGEQKHRTHEKTVCHIMPLSETEGESVDVSQTLAYFASCSGCSLMVHLPRWRSLPGVHSDIFCTCKTTFFFYVAPILSLHFDFYSTFFEFQDGCLSSALRFLTKSFCFCFRLNTMSAQSCVRPVWDGLS